MIWSEPNARERLELMKNSTNVAIVGASDNPARASYFVSTYLLSSSHFKLFFVNPRLETLLGHPVYKSLADIPELEFCLAPDFYQVLAAHLQETILRSLPSFPVLRQRASPTIQNGTGMPHEMFTVTIVRSVLFCLSSRPESALMECLYLCYAGYQRDLLLGKER